MKKSTIIFSIIIVILIIILGFMTYSRFHWLNAWKNTANDVIKLNDSLEKAGVVVLFSQSGDSKIVIRQENNVITEEEYNEQLPY